MATDANSGDVRAHLLSVARELFYRQGYQKVTMRAIATRAAMSLGNIYNYFPTKAILFEAVLAPALVAIDALDNQCVDLDPTSGDWLVSMLPVLMRNFSKLVEQFHKELHIMFCGIQGFCPSNYRDKFIEDRLLAGKRFHEQFLRQHSEVEMEYSELFYRVRCAEWYEAMRLLVQSAGMTAEERESFIQYYALFATAGWQALLTAPSGL